MALWGNRDSKSASGSIVIDSDGNVTGIETLFTTEAKVGNTIIVGDEQYVIVAINAHDSVTVKASAHGKAIAEVNSPTGYRLNEKPVYVSQSESQGDSSKVFGVDTAEIYQGAGMITDIAIIQGGTNYTEVPNVTIQTGEEGQAYAEATLNEGRSVDIITVTGGGNFGYNAVPNVYVDVPRRTIAVTAVNTSTETITYNDHGLANGDALVYYAAGGTAMGGLSDEDIYYAGEVTTNTFKLYNTRARGTTSIGTLVVATSQVNVTPNTISYTDHGLVTGAELNYSNQGGASITGLTSGNDYFVIKVDADTFKLALTANNATAGTAIDLSGTGNDSQTFTSTGRINISGTGNNDQYFDLTDETTATAKAVLGSGTEGEGWNGYSNWVAGEQHVTHSGWVRKTVGTGGRAGRVQYETLVAMGSISGDANDDIQFPDD